MTDKKIILVTGATGHQGGATLRHLEAMRQQERLAEFALRAMTRNPRSDAARALADRGVEVVQADLDDEASLERALAGVWGVYAVQNTAEAGVAGEETQGVRLVKKAHEAGVEHYVYASVGSADRKTGIPHFDNKARVETALRAAGFVTHTIIRPVFFMENLLSPRFLQEDKLFAALAPDTKLQMIAVDDIGRFGAAALVDPQKWQRAEVDIAGDEVTLPQAARCVSEIVGKPITFQPIPVSAVRQNSQDMALMFEWFESTGYSVNIQELGAQWGIVPMTVAEWARSKRA